MSGDDTQLTDQQMSFVCWYVKLLNATRAAERAGYQGNENTLGVTGHDLLTRPKIRAEIDKQLKASIPTADETLSLISSVATVDLTPYLREDMTLDVQAMARAGLGRLVKGIKPGREGPEITLRDPDGATKMLARYHRLLDKLEIDMHTTVSTDLDTLDALAKQIAAAKQGVSTEQDDTP